MKNRFFKLPFQFDVPRLLHDLDICIQEDWANHFNQKDYSGEWTGIALRSATGHSKDIYANPTTEGYVDTALLTRCLYFQDSINQFDCKKEGIRLLALTPGSHVKEHRDQGLAYAFGIFRIHIPITTDEKVAFIVDGTDLKMAAGDCWYANFDLPHSVEHHGTQRRIHLVLDCLRNEWSDALFKEVGYDFDVEKQPKSLSITVKQQMIEQFQLMDTDAARQLIVQLTKEIEEETALNAQNMEERHPDGSGTEGGKNSYASLNTDSPEWIPTQLIKKEDTWFAQWTYLNGKQFTEPFFEDSIAKCKAHNHNSKAAKNITTLEHLVEVGKEADNIDPTAFIFHVSRCGSTLLSQLLATDERHIVLSEVPLLDTILALKDTPNNRIEAFFQAALRLLGRKRTGLEERLFIKLDSWHIAYYPMLRRMYPNTPFILLYRSPDEVFYSHKKQPGIQAVPGMLDPILFGFTSKEIMDINPDYYIGKVLENYLEAFIKVSKTDDNAYLINYKNGIDTIIQQISTITAVSFDNYTLDKMKQRSRFHAKHPQQVFNESLPIKPLPTYLQKAYQAYQHLEAFVLKC